ncbi:MAG TPA: ABC transporter permease [Gaiellaceae bacterium]|jgi:ribose/xylose/arabinose/galactoside ABC-type transport system permease subunit
MRVSRAARASAVSTALAGSGFVPVWLATGALLVIAQLIAPETLSGDSFRSGVLPFMTFLAVAALGEMLVIMTGGIDLSIPGVIVLVANVVVGFSGGENDRLAIAIVACLAWSALIGLVNGLLVGVAGLNALIVTLAVGQIAVGVTVGYARSIANESAVPPALSSWATDEFLGISWLFWVGLLLTIALALALRYTTVGRRFQLVGANSRAAWIAGIRVQRYVVLAYVAAAVLYGVAGILLAAFIRSPSIDLGDPYLLGPIAAVVIGGASLAGGLASATSTWVAAFALTLLGQMLRVLGLTTAWQYAVYGAAIAAGMVISGERIVGVFGGLLQRRRVKAWIGTSELDLDEPDQDRREVLEERPVSL